MRIDPQALLACPSYLQRTHDGREEASTGIKRNLVTCHGYNGTATF